MKSDKRGDLSGVAIQSIMISNWCDYYQFELYFWWFTRVMTQPSGKKGKWFRRVCVKWIAFVSNTIVYSTESTQPIIFKIAMTSWLNADWKVKLIAISIASNFPQFAPIIWKYPLYNFFDALNLVHGRIRKVFDWNKKKAKFRDCSEGKNIVFALTENQFKTSRAITWKCFAFGAVQRVLNELADGRANLLFFSLTKVHKTYGKKFLKK